MASDPFGNGSGSDPSQPTPWSQPPAGQSPPPPPGAMPPPGSMPPPAGQQPSYQAYPAAPTYAGATNPFDSRSTTVLILGILGFVLCQILGPVAWVMGNKVQAEALAAGWPEPSNNKAGRILGIIGTVLLVLGVLFFVLFFVVLAAGAGSSSSL